MADRTLIVHGWSDCSDSFRSLKSFLVGRGVGAVESVYYADYESREDAVTYEDVVGGLHDELRRRGLVDGRGRGSFDAVVHSAGALVIRHWIWRYYGDRIERCPLENLVMLAPANFGSPLAHRGKSLLGRTFAGRWKVGDLFEVGRGLLNGLELGSPYQWELAHRDLLGEEPFYDADRVRLTVLVGLDDYEGVRGWVGKPGTDGAVVIAGTTVGSVKLELDFSDPDRPRRWERDTRHGRFAFGALRGLDHGSVVEAFDPQFGPGEGAEREGGELVRGHLLDALRVDGPEAFLEHRRRVARTRAAAYDPATYADPREAPDARWQQFLLHAVDDQDQPVRDFSVEFLVRRRDPPGRPAAADAGPSRRNPPELTAPERELSRVANRLMTAHFHAYGPDPSYRRILVDGSEVEELLPADHVLALRIHVPRVDEGIYYDTERLQPVVVHDPSAAGDDAGPGPGARPAGASGDGDGSASGEGTPDGDGSADGDRPPAFFHPNTTTLVQMRVNRVTDYVTVGRGARRR